MARWAPAKTDILDELVAEVRHNYPNGRIVIAVDGVDGSGTDRFADELAEAYERSGLASVRASIDAFLASEPDGEVAVNRYYAEAYDYAAFQDALVRPFRRERPFRVAPESDERELDGDAALVVDGPFLLRPELFGAWTSTVCLFVPTEQAFARAGGPPDSVRRQAEELYLHRVQPRAKAIANIDNTDPEHPRRTFSDSC